MNLRYGTHYPVLATAVSRTKGPVLELGGGFFSTPMLHLMCAPDRRLVTIETSPEWYAKSTDLKTAWHEIYLIEPGEEDNLKLIDEVEWGVVFIDHSPTKRRIIDINRFKNKTHFMVVHDTEAGCYNYEPTFKTFRYRWDWKRWKPWTSVLSMKEDFSKLMNGS